MEKKVRGEASAGFRKSEAAKEALISATIEMLKIKSIEAISTREVASSSRQNISAITYYFGSKEGLYIAAVERIARVIRTQMNPTFRDINKFLRNSQRDPDVAIGLIKSLLRRIMSFHKDILGFTEIIAREQIHPTEAFPILYDEALRDLHELGGRLVAAALGNAELDEECRLRFHALLGEVLIFRYARETILRNVGWTDIGERENDIVATIIEEHIEVTLSEIARRRQSKACPVGSTKEKPLLHRTKRKAV